MIADNIHVSYLDKEKLPVVINPKDSGDKSLQTITTFLKENHRSGDCDPVTGRIKLKANEASITGNFVLTTP